MCLWTGMPPSEHIERRQTITDMKKRDTVSHITKMLQTKYQINIENLVKKEVRGVEILFCLFVSLVLLHHEFRMSYIGYLPWL